MEKPSLELAKKYTSSGEYYWNAGQYVWRADSLLEAFGKYEPTIREKLNNILNVIGSQNEKKTVLSEYESMPKISIDYALAEKADNMAVVPGEFFWTDIGDWKEVWENLNKDENGNVIIDGDEPGGRVMNIDTTEALIHSDGKLIAVIGIDNIVVVDTKEALLVVSKSRAQSVKKIVEELKKEKAEDLL